MINHSCLPGLEPLIIYTYTSEPHVFMLTAGGALTDDAAGLAGFWVPNCVYLDLDTVLAQGFQVIENNSVLLYVADAFNLQEVRSVFRVCG